MRRARGGGGGMPKAGGNSAMTAEHLHPVSADLNPADQTQSGSLLQLLCACLARRPAWHGAGAGRGVSLGPKNCVNI